MAKWYGIAIVVISIIVLICSNAIQKKSLIKIYFSDCIVLSIIVYITGITYINGQLSINITVVLFLIFCLFYAIKNNIKVWFTPFIIAIIGGITLESIYCIYHYICRGITLDLWTLDGKGHFDNSTGFAASVLCGIPFCLHYLRQIKKSKAVVIAFILCIIGIITSGSRSAYISIFVILIIHFYSPIKSLFCKSKWYIKPFYFTIPIILLILCYAIKIDSANGRLLIWRCSIDMICDNPLLGYGPWGFHANYMNYQAHYFQYNPNSMYQLLADDVKNPFNETLNLLIQFGLVGISMIGILIIGAIKQYINNQTSEKRTALITIIILVIYSSFSYPFSYPLPCVVFGGSLVILYSGETPIRTLHKNHQYIYCFIITCAIAACVHITRNFLAMKDLHTAINYTSLKNDNSIKKKFSAISQLNDSPYYHYSYAAALNKIHSFHESNEELLICQNKITNYDIQLLFADNYTNLEQYDMAEKHLLQASYMCPNRFMPYYQLVLLYDKIGAYEQAYYIALQIQNKPIKIPSATVNDIISEMKLYVAKFHFFNSNNKDR